MYVPTYLEVDPGPEHPGVRGGEQVEGGVDVHRGQGGGVPGEPLWDELRVDRQPPVKPPAVQGVGVVQAHPIPGDIRDQVHRGPGGDDPLPGHAAPIESPGVHPQGVVVGVVYRKLRYVGGREGGDTPGGRSVRPAPGVPQPHRQGDVLQAAYTHTPYTQSIPIALHYTHLCVCWCRLDRPGSAPHPGTARSPTRAHTAAGTPRCNRPGRGSSGGSPAAGWASCATPAHPQTPIYDTVT